MSQGELYRSNLLVVEERKIFFIVMREGGSEKQWLGKWNARLRLVS